jgi:hypothetical protein
LHRIAHVDCRLPGAASVASQATVDLRPGAISRRSRSISPGSRLAGKTRVWPIIGVRLFVDAETGDVLGETTHRIVC